MVEVKEINKQLNNITHHVRRLGDRLENSDNALVLMEAENKRLRELVDELRENKNNCPSREDYWP